MSERLGLRPAAAKLGISHVSLLKACKTGRVTRGDDGLFDVDQAREQLKKNSHPIKAKAGRTQQSKPPAAESKAEADENAPGLDLNSIITAHERVKLEKAQLSLAVQKGLLVEKAAVNAFVAGMILAARDVLLQMGPGLRDKLAKISDPVEVETVLMADVHRALRKLGEYRGPDAADGELGGSLGTA